MLAYILIGACIIGVLLIKNFLILISKYETKEKPIIYYHPIIKNKYCKLIILESLKKISTKEIQNRLIQCNNYLLENHPYLAMADRLQTINNNHDMQTIFNLINEI